jgi:hypothetical protein
VFVKIADSKARSNSLTIQKRGFGEKDWRECYSHQFIPKEVINKNRGMQKLSHKGHTVIHTAFHSMVSIHNVRIMTETGLLIVIRIVRPKAGDYQRRRNIQRLRLDRRIKYPAATAVTDALMHMLPNLG